MDFQKRPLLFSLLTMALVTCSSSDLTIGFYNQTCPSAESLVQQAVAQAFANDSGIAPGLIRLHFHDCFVGGCDASVLLDSTPNNPSEKDAPPNKNSLRGFEAINAAKLAVEEKCPQVVSCADIIAFAARDSVQLTGNITYEVPSGRRDGTTWNASETANLPSPFLNSAELIKAFAKKNLTAEEMVTLSGAHTIGISHCSSFTNRLYNGSTSSVDPTLSEAYAALLQMRCPNTNTTASVTVALDLVTPTVLDNKYYAALQLKLGLLTSDQALVADPTLSAVVKSYADSQNEWATNFTQAMVKMGEIEVLTGTAGEIRKNCSLVNSAGNSTLLLYSSMYCISRFYIVQNSWEICTIHT